MLTSTQDTWPQRLPQVQLCCTQQMYGERCDPAKITYSKIDLLNRDSSSASRALQFETRCHCCIDPHSTSTTHGMRACSHDKC